MAEAAGVGLSTVKSIEAGKATIPATLAAVKAALVIQGVEFFDEGGTSGIKRGKKVD